MEFSAEDYRLMARTFRLRAADATLQDEIERLVGAARRHEQLAKLAEQEARKPAKAGR
jgi:hypothetical protein